MPPVHATRVYRDTQFRYTDEPYVEKLPLWGRVSILLAAAIFAWGVVVGFGFALLSLLA